MYQFVRILRQWKYLKDQNESINTDGEWQLHFWEDAKPMHVLRRGKKDPDPLISPSLGYISAGGNVGYTFCASQWQFDAWQSKGNIGRPVRSSILIIHVAVNIGCYKIWVVADQQRDIRWCGFNGCSHSNSNIRGKSNCKWRRSGTTYKVAWSTITEEQFDGLKCSSMVIFGEYK